MSFTEPGDSAPRTILIVDDDRDTRELWALAFREDGFRAVAAQSMADGLAWLRSGEMFDFVLTDYWLADGGGETLLREAYAHDLMRGVGALICTCHPLIESSSYAPVIHKPIAPSALVALVRTLLLASSAAAVLPRG